MAIQLKDHEKLHGGVARAVLAGGGAALLAMFLPAQLGPALMALAVGAAIAPPQSWRAAAWMASCALVAGGAALVGGALGALGVAVAVGAMLARGQGAEKLLSGGLGALGALGAGLVGRAIVNTEALAFLPSGLEALGAGAASGLMVGVSSIGRHIERTAPRADELAGVTFEGELGQLLRRALAAHRDAVAAMGEEAPQARLAANDLIARMARFGRHWQQVEQEASHSRAGDLEQRAAQLDLRLAATSDPLARSEFARAREALGAQLSYLKEIDRGRERAVARLEHQVATLERLRLAAVRHRSVDAGRLGAELQPVVEELAQAGQDLDIESEALSEAVATAAPVALPVVDAAPPAVAASPDAESVALHALPPGTSN